ncbi:MAG TPA: hypothetical protein VII27_06720 [Thermoplasmata archaeon]
MGYLARRIVGYVVFFAVLGILSSIAVSANASSGGTLLAGTSGAVVGLAVLFTAFLSSWIVRRRMRRLDRRRRAWR